MSKQLREVANVYYGKSPSEVLSKEENIPVIGTGGIYNYATKALFNGPAVIVPRKGSLGNPWYIKEPFWASDTTYAVLPKDDVSIEWLYYCLDQFDLSTLNEATGVPSISRDWLYKIPVPDMKPTQQRRIAEILSTIDGAIEQTEALIKKTQQIKAGLMHDLFTRGVLPNGQLRPPREEAPELYKDSRTPLGWLPKEWEFGELRQWLSYISYGFTNPMPESEEGPYMVTAADVSEGVIQYDMCRRTSHIAYERLLTQKSRPRIGDVLLTKDGTLGRIAVVDREHVCINQSVAVLRPADSAHSRFLAALLSASRWQQKMISDAGGSTIKHIYISVVKKMVVAWTIKSDEITAIMERTSWCEMRLVSVQMSMQKLQMIKNGLIHDLLTGRVPVIKEKETN